MKLTLANMLLLAATLAVSIAVPAQTVVPKAIVFIGAPQSQAELLALSGLTPGKALTKDDIEAAMHRLDDSGLFADIRYGVAAGTLTFTLELAAKSQMQRVQYVNFVWYTPDQLNEAVHAILPFFTGSVPANGELKEQVASALEAILKERGIKATVVSEGVAGNRLDYRILSPQVIVSDLKIENVNFNSDPVLLALRNGLVGSEYLEGVTARAVRGNLSYALKELGFLDETVGPVGHAEPAADPNRIGVAMTGAAEPGARYTVARVTLPPPAGTVTAAELESEHQVKSGGLPSPSLVDNTVARLAFVFAGHGFLDAAASVDASKDPEAHTMSYAFHIVPSEVYHMRNLVFAPGLGSGQQTPLHAAWKLSKGAVYDRGTAEVSLLAPAVKSLCGGQPASQELLPDKATHEVDVKLSCVRGR